MLCIRAIRIGAMNFQKIQYCFGASFLYFHIFHFFSPPSIGMQSLPSIFPSVEFPNVRNVSCVSCFSWKQIMEILEKRCSMRMALIKRRLIYGPRPTPTPPINSRFSQLRIAFPMRMKMENIGFWIVRDVLPSQSFFSL